MASWNINDVSKAYAKGFVKFLKDNNIDNFRSSSYELFVYSISAVYGIPYNKRLNSLIKRKGNKCIKYLSSLSGVPKKAGRLSREDRKRLVECSCVYVVVAMQYYSGGIEVVKL